MDTRADFQRLLDDMDKVIQAKRQELLELDERLESARGQLAEKEAKELSRLDEGSPLGRAKDGGQELERALEKQSQLYEQQLAEFNDEFAALESINEELARENGQLREALAARADEAAELAKKSKLLVESLEEVHAANLELNLRLAKSEAELKLQQKLLEKLHKEDELLMDAFNHKLELLNQAVQSRDHEIQALRAESRVTLESLGVEMDAEAERSGLLVVESKERVIKVASALRDKDSQIELLKSQLLQATRDLERNASLLELMNKKQQQQQQQSEVSPEEAAGSEWEDKCRMLEEELEAKDRQLHLVEFKNHQYEIVMPNKISDLLQRLIEFYYRKSSNSNSNPAPEQTTEGSEQVELLISNLNRLLTEVNSTQGLLYKIDQLREESERKGTQIERLVSELNELHAKLSGEQVEEPAERGQQKARSGSPEVDLGGRVSRRARGKWRRSFRRVEFKASQASPVEESNKVESANQAEADEPAVSEQSGASLGGDRKNGAGRAEGLGELEERLRQLEGENELLELAMKEILLSIKWSDGQCCTILVDCPSLERVCQLMEARHIAAGAREPPVEGEPSRQVESLLFQLVLLKAELDLLRGQNEQLRAELKVQRRDYLDYLSGLSSLEEAPASDRKQLEEAHCQTEGALEGQLGRASADEKCSNCDRLGQLIGHLVESIGRIQSRLEASEDNYMQRLINLHKLVQVLEKDLSARERLLIDARRQCQLLLQRKLTAETKLELYERQGQLSKSTFGRQPAQPIRRSVILFNNNMTTSDRQLERSEIIFDNSLEDNSDEDNNSFGCD